MYLPCRSLFLTLLTLTGFAPTAAPAATVIENVSFNDDGADFTVVSTNAPGGPWTHSETLGSWSSFDRTDCGPTGFRASRLNSPAWTMVENGPLFLSFSHRYSFEADTTRWDGGQLRISVNGGPYTLVPLAAFTVNGYNNTIGGADTPNSEILGQQAFTAQSAGYATPAFLSSSVNLGSFSSNDTISIQFLAAWDDCSQGMVPNWEIDSLSFNPPLEDRKLAPDFTDPTLPPDASVIEGQRHTLQARVVAVPAPTFQWFKDGLEISAATNDTYTITNMTAAQEGQYFLRAANSEGTSQSRSATITFAPDTTPPTLVSGILRRDNTVLLSFSEPLDAAYGFDPFSGAVFAAQDGIGGDLGVASAVLTNQTNFVISLRTAPLPDIDYELGLVNGVISDSYDNPYDSGLEDGVHRIFHLNRESVVLAIDVTPRWKYNDRNIDFQSQTPSVFDVSFDDSSWAAGAALLGMEIAATPEPLRTAISNTPLTTYYRTRFNLPTTPLLALSMRAVIDDGARIFFNGVEVFRSAGMPPIPTPMAFGAAAGRTIGDGAYEGPFDLPISNLVAGENLMVVALHQSAAGSSDNLWGCELVGTFGLAVPSVRITHIRVDPAGNPFGNVKLEHNGTDVYLQETTNLNGSPITWTTLPGGPHPSPYDAGPASGMRFFRLSDTP